jgi:hypothetical protein
LYKNRREGQVIADLYPQIVDWFVENKWKNCTKFLSETNIQARCLISASQFFTHINKARAHKPTLTFDLSTSQPDEVSSLKTKPINLRWSLGLRLRKNIRLRQINLRMGKDWFY